MDRIKWYCKNRFVHLKVLTPRDSEIRLNTPGTDYFCLDLVNHSQLNIYKIRLVNLTLMLPFSHFHHFSEVNNHRHTETLKAFRIPFSSVVVPTNTIHCQCQQCCVVLLSLCSPRHAHSANSALQATYIVI